MENPEGTEITEQRRGPYKLALVPKWDSRAMVLATFPLSIGSGPDLK
jgi:hypothetical protein